MWIKSEGTAQDIIPPLKNGEELHLYTQPGMEISQQPGMVVTQVSRVAVVRGVGQWQFKDIIGWQIITQKTSWLKVAAVVGIVILFLRNKK